MARNTLILLSGLLLCTSSAWAAPGDPSPRKSTFLEFAERESAGQIQPTQASGVRRGEKRGPNPVAHNYVLKGRSGSGNAEAQPDVLFDKSDRRIKKWVMKKAWRIVQKERDPWKIVEGIQKAINARVKHPGNELDVTKNPNAYTRFNYKTVQREGLARLGDYLTIGMAACREKAFLTQVALETAGFKARLSRGNIHQNGKVIGGHVWNEVWLDGKWLVVDTTNPIFNKVTAKVITTTGSYNGWIWNRDATTYRMIPGERDHRLRKGYKPPKRIERRQRQQRRMSSSYQRQLARFRSR